MTTGICGRRTFLGRILAAGGLAALAPARAIAGALGRPKTVVTHEVLDSLGEVYIRIGTTNRCRLRGYDPGELLLVRVESHVIGRVYRRTADGMARTEDLARVYSSRLTWEVPPAGYNSPMRAEQVTTYNGDTGVHNCEFSLRKVVA